MLRNRLLPHYPRKLLDTGVARQLLLKELVRTTRRGRGIILLQFAAQDAAGLLRTEN